ncbi:Chaperone protein ClpB1 [Dendrobium catenatum]|uniref:Chaperone protein ClpB1 n=1 Tax=Dendrobium catenatum TaxID=906689 RepID=A0A2I0W5Q4_9ASPA|nr:Chaperone protein ClpB1 [Dendrobium catenatum]
MKRSDEVVHILSYRIKNNNVLVDELGVGKRAVDEGLVQRIMRGDVPRNLADVRQIALDMGTLVAGAKYMGELEESFKIWCAEEAETKVVRSRISGRHVSRKLKLDGWIMRSHRLERT